MGAGAGMSRLASATFADTLKAFGQPAIGNLEAAISSIATKPADAGEVAFLNPVKEGVCSDCKVLAVKPDLVYENGFLR